MNTRFNRRTKVAVHGSNQRGCHVAVIIEQLHLYAQVISIELFITNFPYIFLKTDKNYLTESLLSEKFFAFKRTLFMGLLCNFVFTKIN